MASAQIVVPENLPEAARRWAPLSGRLRAAKDSHRSAGAAAGLGGAIITRGGEVRIPAESILTFQIARPLDIGIPDNGDMRDGRHYHEYR